MELLTGVMNATETDPTLALPKNEQPDERRVEIAYTHRYSYHEGNHTRTVERIQIIRGRLLRTPDDATIDGLEDGREHAETYHLRTEGTDGRYDNRQPVAILYLRDIVEIVLLEPPAASL